MKEPKTDRRIIRSKTLLKNALRELMSRKKFKYITVKEISDLSTINRATFYKHYIDQHVLLADVFREDFHHLLEERTKEMNKIDRKLLRQIILVVSEFLSPSMQRYLSDHPSIIPLEQKMIQQAITIRLLHGMGAEYKTNGDLLRAKVKAAMAGWSIYAAVNQWLELLIEKKLDREDTSIEKFAENIIDPVLRLIK